MNVIVPLITPSHLPDIFPLIDRIIEGGISSFFLLGTTGEASKLEQKRKIQLITKVTPYIGKRARLLVGITSSHLQDSIELMQVVDQVGAYASVVIPLLLGKTSRVLETLLNSSSGNLLLYNNPMLTTDKNLPIEDIKSFVQEKRIIGIKDSSDDFIYLEELLNLRRTYSHFKVYYGRENNLLEAFLKDVDGFVPASGNVEPRLIAQLWQMKEKGPWKEWHAFKALLKEKDPKNYINGLKLLLKERGLISHTRLLDSP